MRLIAINKKIVLECKYEQRTTAKEMGATWNIRRKQWIIETSLTSYLKIKNNPNIKISQNIVNFFEKKRERLHDNTMTTLLSNFKFKTTPYPHQLRIVEKILNNPMFLIYLGVGTGKTKIAIDWFTVLFSQNKVKNCLVVCPKSIMFNFNEEIKIHSHFSSTIILGTLKKRELALSSTNEFHIINYENLVTMKKNIIKKKYDVIIFDEFHYCKNINSTRARNCLAISKDCTYKIGMTGTAICNSKEDIFMLNKIINPFIFGKSFTKFKYNYFFMGVNGLEEKNKEEFGRLLSINSVKLSLRDIVDLPKEIIVKKQFKLSEKSKKTYDTLKEEMVIEVDKDPLIPITNILNKIIKLSQITSGFISGKDENENKYLKDISSEKLDLLMTILGSTEGKVIVFAKFTHSIDKIVERCQKEKISTCIYDGRTKKEGVYKTFNEDDTKVFIAQIQKGEGYSIPNAKVSIFYEMNYSRKDHVQCKGRNLRLVGSESSPCVYIYLMAYKTIDEIIYETLLNKDFNSNEVMKFVRGI